MMFELKFFFFRTKPCTPRRSLHQSVLIEAAKRVCTPKVLTPRQPLEQCTTTKKSNLKTPGAKRKMKSVFFSGNDSVKTLDSFEKENEGAHKKYIKTPIRLVGKRDERNADSPIFDLDLTGLETLSPISRRSSFYVQGTSSQKKKYANNRSILSESLQGIGRKMSFNSPKSSPIVFKGK